MKTDAQHPPGFKRMPQHQKLAFAVGGGANGGPGQPGVSDLASIRRAAAMGRMSRRPGPAFQIPEPSRAEQNALTPPHDREWHGRSGLFPCERGMDVLDRLRSPLGHGAPAIKFGIDAGG